MQHTCDIRVLATAAVLGAAALVAASAVSAAPAGALPDGLRSVQQVHYRYQPRTRVRVYRRHYTEHDYPYGPPIRGFYDRNPAHQGNINGCAVDLGYGRYESCNVNR